MLAIVAAVMLAAAPQNDTVFMTDGGRVIGIVVEEGPQGVSLQMPDGSFRRFARREVSRIVYADGSVSRVSEPPPPAAQAPAPPYTPAPPAQPRTNAPPPQQAYPPPPAYVPPPPPPYYPPPPYAYRPPPPAPPPPYVRPAGPLSPVYLSFGLGGAFRGGEAEDRLDIDRVFDNQLDLQFEGGIRVTPHTALGLYADVGLGDPSREVRNQCSAQLIDCDATTGRFGFVVRHTFEPAARTTPWFSLGTGFEYGTVSTDDTLSGGTHELFSYTGWEIARLQAGFDLRGSGVLGVGFYAGVALGRYFKYEDDFVTDHLGDRRAFHGTVEGGVRFTLFP
jgi:hypothetical protein